MFFLTVHPTSFQLHLQLHNYLHNMYTLDSPSEVVLPNLYGLHSVLWHPSYHDYTCIEWKTFPVLSWCFLFYVADILVSRMLPGALAHGFVGNVAQLLRRFPFAHIAVGVKRAVGIGHDLGLFKESSLLIFTNCSLSFCFLMYIINRIYAATNAKEGRFHVWTEASREKGPTGRAR